MSICPFGITHPDDVCCLSTPSTMKTIVDCDHSSSRRCCFTLRDLTAEKARQQSWAISGVENQYLSWDFLMLKVHQAITLHQTKAKVRGVLCFEEMCKLSETGFTFTINGPNVTIRWFFGYQTTKKRKELKPVPNTRFLNGELTDIQCYIEKALSREDQESVIWTKTLENDEKRVEAYLNNHIGTHTFRVNGREISWVKRPLPSSCNVAVAEPGSSYGFIISNSASELYGSSSPCFATTGSTGSEIPKVSEENTPSKPEKVEPEQLKTQGSTVPCSARSSFEKDIKKFMKNNKPPSEKHEYSLKEKEAMMKEFASILDLSPLVSMFIPNLSSAFEDVDGHRMKIVLDTLKNTPIPWNKAKQELLAIIPKEYQTMAKVFLNVKVEEATETAETKVEKSDTPDLLSQIFSGFRPSSIPKSEETSLPPKTDHTPGVDGLLAMLAQFGKAT